MASETVNPVTIRGPLRRADLPGLYARVCAAMSTRKGGLLVCDVSEVASDAVAVDALCRLHLGARRHGCEVRLLHASAELIALITLLGLEDVLARATNHRGGVEARRAGKAAGYRGRR